MLFISKTASRVIQTIKAVPSVVDNLNARATYLLCGGASDPSSFSSNMLGAMPFILATDIKTGLGKGLTIVMMIGFIYGIIQIIGGVVQLRKGDPDGKMGIVAGVLIAGSIAIMKAAFAAFGLDSSSLAAQGL